jgi:hypothetical protein
MIECRDSRSRFVREMYPSIKDWILRGMKMRPTILEKARHKVIELTKIIGKWIINGMELIGRSHTGLPYQP